MKSIFFLFILIGICIFGVLWFSFFQRTFSDTPHPTVPQMPSLTPSPVSSASVHPIQLTEPKAGEKVKNPLTIKGKAPGFWFFEGQMDARLESSSGMVVGTGVLRAEGEWMTDRAVSFSGLVPFEDSANTPLKLIIQKTNPSGLAENDQQFVVELSQ